MRAIASARLAALEAVSQPQAASSPRGERGVAAAQEEGKACVAGEHEEGKACVAGEHEGAHENGHAAQAAHDAYGSQDAQDPQGAAPPPWARLAQTWRDSQARVLRATLARAAAADQPREELEEARLEAQRTKRRRA